MADEKEGELPKSAGTALKNPYVLVGVIVAIIAAFLAFLFLVPANYKLIFAIAAAVLVLAWFGSKKEKRVFNMLLIGAIAAAVIVFFPSLQAWASQGSNYASNIYTQTKTGGIGEGLYCSIHPTEEKCFGTGLWKETPTEQNYNSFSINVNWGDKTKTEPLYKVIGLKVKTDAPLVLVPKCYLEDNQIQTSTPQGNTISFEGSNSIQTSSLTCYSEKTTSDKLAVKFEAQNISQTLKTTAWIGEGADKGVLSAENKSGPYSIRIENLDDRQPFGIGRYPLKVIIKSSLNEVNITQIKSLKLWAASSRAVIECNFGDELNAESEISKWIKENGIQCTLNVFEIPTEGAEQMVIETSFNYDIGATFRTILNTTAAK